MDYLFYNPTSAEWKLALTVVLTASTKKKTFENRLKKGLRKTEERTGDRACWDTATRSFYALTSTSVGAHFLSPANWIICQS